MNLAARGWYGFVVDMKATKADIARAVHVQYGVTVTDVQTTVVHGKVKKTGKKQIPVLKPSWKKAEVKLKTGETIDAFDIGGEKEKK